ncbi:DUF4153 domain-containing protein [Frigidibacter albus]|uniref:DUF4153 domain-containing protein n=1 Tax=Frigidibacter albus TaxID=1465486 RepID=A0A6L8VK31_9RHOB|nr:DUF4153 domain-containing protein [Frigidibacter albus]MZQ89972.1 DUF4153 domain-containing protein [Frigidibacter albus]NBE31653.1 DUF4153 domain-containing protein [Frigidibacter albus]GGH55720.1 DUF4153 domain-containing protein [Frigidibacter albus]
MSDSTINGTSFTPERLRLAGFGALAGLCGWLLTDVLAEDLGGTRLHLVLTVLAGVFFADALAMAGQMRARAAVAGAALVALPVAGLALWASLRFASVEDMLRSPHQMLAVLLLAALPVPFLIARGIGAGSRDYPALFLAAWNIVVRYAAAWLFAGVVWAVVFLSDTLLSLVGITAIDWLISEVELVPWLLTGAALGLGLAVVSELAELVSPYLVLRLLRLLLPPLLVVMVIFALALPFRGLSGLFGTFSAAATLMAIALGGVSLISIVVDQTEAEAAHTPLMRGAARAMALLLPVLAGLAVWAVLLRIGQHGLTPDRVAGGLAALVVMGYALLYAASVLSGAAWMDRIRQANIAMALVVMAAAALWQTPVLNAEALSARSQLARFQDGRIPVVQLPLHEMRWDWGRPGAAALAELGAVTGHPDQAALDARLAEVNAATGRYAASSEPAGAPALDALRSSLTILPEGRELPDWMLDGLQQWETDGWMEACARTDGAGLPGCVLVIGEFLPAAPGEEALLFLNGGGDSVIRQGFVSSRGTEYRASAIFVAPAVDPGAEALFAALHAGDIRIGPASVSALHIGAAEVLLLPWP